LILLLVFGLSLLSLTNFFPTNLAGLVVSDTNSTTLTYTGPTEIVFFDSLTMDLNQYVDEGVTVIATEVDGLNVLVVDNVLKPAMQHVLNQSLPNTNPHMLAAYAI